MRPVLDSPERARKRTARMFDVLARLDGGESLEMVARDYGLSVGSIRRIAADARWRLRLDEERERRAAQALRPEVV